MRIELDISSISQCVRTSDGSLAQFGEILGIVKLFCLTFTTLLPIMDGNFDSIDEFNFHVSQHLVKQGHYMARFSLDFAQTAVTLPLSPQPRR